MTYANVMSTLAVFAVLGGGAYAATKVRSDDIAKDAVLSKHVKKDQLTGKDINESRLVGVVPYGKRIPSGTMLVGLWGGGHAVVETNNGGDFLVSLPAPATAPLRSDDVNFGAEEPDAGDADPDCTGTSDLPTAPPGKVCLYSGTNVGGSPTFSGDEVDGGDALSRLGFTVVIDGQADAPDTIEAHGSWAYTAP
jgi:hypothetical protein